MEGLVTDFRVPDRDLFLLICTPFACISLAFGVDGALDMADDGTSMPEAAMTSLARCFPSRMASLASDGALCCACADGPDVSMGF